MRNRKNWKKIAAILMTTAFLLQGTAAMAEEAPAAETPVTEAVQTKAAPETEAPQTEAPQTEAPQTEAPQTEAPQTEAPQTEAPQTEAPQTEAPQTEAPVTEAPATEAPVTETPATEAPVTEAPATEAPATEAPVTEAPATEAPATEAPVTEAPATEAPATEAPAEETLPAETEIETETETEKVVYKTSFRFENEEVLITAGASEAAKLPENTEMRVEKLQPGTQAYEAAKAVVEAKTGAREGMEYLFYDVNFFSDGQKVSYPEGTVTIQIQFKQEQKNSAEGNQSVLHIDENSQVKDVTAPTAEGSAMSSVNFAL